MSDRVFSEDEVQKLIRRAAELEAEKSVPGKGSGSNGLTIDELKAVASDAGLDPQFIEQAALEYDAVSKEVTSKVQVNRDEIVTEVWLDSHPDSETINVLITELNHLYGTTDELNWWENLWGTHEGKAKVTRTSTSAEWNYKTEAGMYSTRVLLQQRGERFRIRVSKRQIMNLEWESNLNSLFLVLPVFIFFSIFGAVGSSQIFDAAWPGFIIGSLLSFFSYPVFQYFTKRSVEKQKLDISNTVNQLSRLILQSSTQNSSTGEKEERARSASEIEIPEEPDASDQYSGKLRNNLRE
jgi:hypothetical protein